MLTVRIAAMPFCGTPDRWDTLSTNRPIKTSETLYDAPIWRPPRSFIELGEDLRSWGAPEALIQRCLVAAEEERNHTLLMDMLAKKYDGCK